MILQGIKQASLRKKYDAVLAKTDVCRFVPVHKIKSVGILACEDLTSAADLQKEIEAVLGVGNTKIYSLRRFSKADAFSYHHFTERDVNWKGQFTQKSFHIFLDEPFDLLIGYFHRRNIFLESAVLQSKAQVKVGFSNINSKLYEIEIVQKDAHLKSFIGELKKYLEIIKKL
jgi:hypothetical protein